MILDIIMSFLVSDNKKALKANKRMDMLIKYNFF